jgi:hypothetical protein
LTIKASIIAAIVLALSAFGSEYACADEWVAPATPAVGLSDYFANWFARVDQTQGEQPHWKAPLTTTTPLLTELVRYDQYWENLPGGARLQTFDSGKGLELIPAERIQLILALPPYEELRGPNSNANGFGDWPFLLIKYRILSANEQEGNYVLTAFLQGSAPTGAKRLSTDAYAIIPTIAGGIGWGNFQHPDDSKRVFPDQPGIEDRGFDDLEPRPSSPFRRGVLAGSRDELHLFPEWAECRQDPDLDHAQPHRGVHTD